MDYIEYSIKKKKKAQRIKLAIAVLLFIAVLLIAIKLLSGNGGRNGETSAVQSGEDISGENGETAEISYDGGTVTTTSARDTSSSAPGTVRGGTTSSATKTTVASEGNTYEYAYAGFNPSLADTDTDKWWLLLVNREYILPDDYTVSLAEAAPGTGVNLDARVAPHYAEMYEAAKEDGITLTPLSGHRRISTQRKNFENKISYYQNQGYSKAEATQFAAKIILPPGTSEHNAGLAMDICSLDVSFEKSDEFAWLEVNAVNYGFILRYPKDKTDITEITYEPWHWRYVGVTDAKKIKALGVCLEEYLNMN